MCTGREQSSPFRQCATRPVPADSLGCCFSQDAPDTIVHNSTAIHPIGRRLPPVSHTHPAPTGEEGAFRLESRNCLCLSPGPIRSAEGTTYNSRKTILVTCLRLRSPCGGQYITRCKYNGLVSAICGLDTMLMRLPARTAVRRSSAFVCFVRLDGCMSKMNLPI